jgi:hypothetical protein
MLSEGVLRISAPQDETLYLEVEDGDNPPLALSRFRLQYATQRLIFKANTGRPVSLYFDNPKASSPHYDIALVADELMNSTKVEAVLGSAASTSQGQSNKSGSSFVSPPWIFWYAMAAVVVVLLLVIRKLLPG